jgi:ABC-2 type transport system ATP-binding protein
MSTIAELAGVSMRYEAVLALDDVSFALKKGETLALLGPNGAGKSTAISLLTGQKRVQQGRVRLFGGDPRTPRVRAAIGVTPQEAGFPAAWRVGEIIDFVRRHFPRALPRGAVIEAFGLEALLTRNAAQLSGGQQRTLAVALAFCGGPDAVFLDEPTTGLDVAARQRLWDYVKQFRHDGGAVLLTTHYLEEAQALSDRVVLMTKGRVLREGSMADIRGAVGVQLIHFNAAQPPRLAAARLAHTRGERYTYLTHDADQAVRELVASGTEFSSLEVAPASLAQAVSELLRDAA